MPNRSSTDDRTVLISSRIDELGSSRRAAFRAVHDKGWIPLLYEIDPAEWLAAQGRGSEAARLTQQAYEKECNERLITNSILNAADYFIGIYGTSLGDPSTHLGGLRPLEYEILRFLDIHMARETGEKLDWLEVIYRPSCSPGVWAALRKRLSDALTNIGDPLSPYHKVFRERMALFLKEPPSDVPASSLMYSTIFRLHAVTSGESKKRKESQKSEGIVFFRSRKYQLSGGAVVYFRPSSHLYLKIRLQIQRWRNEAHLVRASRPGGNEVLLEIRTKPSVGEVLHAVKSIFYEGYNVRYIRLGKKTNGARALYVRAAPFLHAGGDLVKTLEKTYHLDVRPYKEVPATLRDFSSRGNTWKLDIIVADRPGMIARALAALAILDMQVLGIGIHDFTPKNAAAPGPLHYVWLIFRRSKRAVPNKPAGKDFQYPENAQFRLECIAADLKSQPGFYSVMLTNNSKRPLRRPELEFDFLRAGRDESQ